MDNILNRVSAEQTLCYIDPSLAASFDRAKDQADVKDWEDSSLVPRPFRGGKGPGVYCLRMRQNIRYITSKIIVYNTQTCV